MRQISFFTLPILLTIAGCGSSESTAPAAQTNAANEDPADDSTAAPANDRIEQASTGSMANDAASSANPRLPLFNAVCGGGIEVHGDEGGPVYIDGNEASLKKFNDNYFEASRGDVTISIAFNPDGSLNLSYTGANRANGICTLS